MGEIQLVVLKKENGKRKGFGFTRKNDSVVALMRCPDCSKENYSGNFLKGICTWCGWKTNQAILET